MASITSPDYFMLDGVSSETVGLFVDTPPVPPLARQRYTTWKTGIDMDNTSADDVFDDITLSLSCYLFANENFDLSAVYGFIQNKTTLQLTRFPDKYFKIRKLNGVTPSQQYDGQRIKVQISFVCAPFKYHTSNSVVTPSSGVVTNPGTRYSRPVYKLTHSGACKLIVNTKVLQIAASITNVNGDGTTSTENSLNPIYIDAERMIAYAITQQGAKVNQTKFTTGAFPFLQPGANLVQTQGCTVEIQGNWRDY